MSCRVPAIEVLLLPKDSNTLSTIFGGVILRTSTWRRRRARKTRHRYVTKAMNAVEFHAPFRGDLVNFFTETTRVDERRSPSSASSRAWGAGRRARQVTEGARGDRPTGAWPIRPEMIAVYAPGSVSNVACGFDIMGFALDEPGDVVVRRRTTWRRSSRSTVTKAG